jgi:hypothetical protein
MGNDVEVLAAKQAITEVLHRYSRGLDRMDRAMAESVWHPGGTADYGPMFNGTGAEFVEWVWAAHAGLDRHSHLVSNILVEVDIEAATAVSETYVAVWLRTPPVDGVVTDIENRGRYADRWSCREGVWAIDHRRYIDDLQRITSAPASPMNNGSAATGRRDATDPSYEVLGSSST